MSNPPIYTIDLSLPPYQRYVQLAEVYKPQLQGLVPLFNEMLHDVGIPIGLHTWINRIARLMLRGVHSSVEHAELRGIAKTTGLPMYLLVAFNVVLDLLMGCTSGAVRSLEEGDPLVEAKMLHFRTLDWGMDSLRSVIVQLEFIRSKSKTPKKVIAQSITYAGFVGVLTGVRRDLSLSLNFRAIHNAVTRKAHFRFYLHHLLVLLGLRPSIASVLRRYLISEEQSNEQGPKDLGTIASEFTPIHTTAAYLFFSDGKRAIMLEKDFSTASIRQSSDFLAITNHDIEDDNSNSTSSQLMIAQPVYTTPNRMADLQDLLDESKDRLESLTKKWKRKVRSKERRIKKTGNILNTSREAQTSTTESEVISWLSDWPTSNECTHFATVLDPQSGRIVWTRVYDKPLRNPQMR